MWRRLRESIGRLLRLGSTPNRIAGGFTLGLGLSLIPIPIVGMLVALALVPVLRVNPVATYTGTAVVNPVTGAAIYFFELWIGMHLCGYPPPRWSELAELDASGWWHLFVDLLGPFAVGAAVTATVASTLSFLLVRAVVKRLQFRLSAPDHRTEPGDEAREDPNTK